MTDKHGDLPVPLARSIGADQSSLHPQMRALTPARLFTGRAGLSYPSQVQLQLRADHAAAIDAVHAELDLQRDFPPAFVADYGITELQSQVRDNGEYLLRPDLGRRLNADARARLAAGVQVDCDLQIVIGDGLSVAAVAAQVPTLLPELVRLAGYQGWTLGPVYVVRYCRVGILNDLGDLLRPRVAVLLVGERPGLATAESLSAYMAYRPCTGQTDADRNLISNIHARGVTTTAAAERIIALAIQMMRSQRSGCEIKESLPGHSHDQSQLAHDGSG